MTRLAESALWTPSTGRFAVTGSRHWPEEEWRIVMRAMGEVAYMMRAAGFEPDLGEGCCSTGLDNLAERLWRYWEREPRHFPALWEACDASCPPYPHRRMRRRSQTSYCPLAGFRRNGQMLDWEPDVLLAFPLGESPGTRDCMKQAQARGIPVIDVAKAVAHHTRGT